MNKRIFAAVIGSAIAGGLLMTNGISAYASNDQNQDSSLGTLEAAASAGSSETTGYYAIEDDGSTREMTEDEIKAFNENVDEQGMISADGITMMSAGSTTEMPLVLNDDGTVREMTQEEYDALKNETPEEYKVEASSEAVTDSFK